MPALEAQFTHIGDAVGGCERLAATPIPFTYGVIIHRTIYLYCLLLPFGLVDSIGSMTPVIVVFVAYTFLALEALGSELEEPFGSQANDLPLDALCWTIETSLLERDGRARLAAIAPAARLCADLTRAAAVIRSPSPSTGSRTNGVGLFVI